MIIVSAADPEYLHRIKALYQSVIANTDAEMHVYLVNVPPDEVAKFYGPRSKVRTEERDFESDEIRRDYMANIRTQLMIDLQKVSVHPQNILWLDADSIVRKSLHKLNQMLSEHDTVALRRLEPEFDRVPSNKFLISTVGLNTSMPSMEFARVWKWQLDEIANDPPSIMKVQLAYYRAIRFCKDRVNWKSIPYSFTDMNHNPESEIWEAQGQRKNRAHVYLAEEAKYLTLFENVAGVTSEK